MNLDWKWVAFGLLIMLGLSILAGIVLAAVLGSQLEGVTSPEDVVLTSGQMTLAALLNFLAFAIGGFIVGLKSAGRTIWEPAIAAAIAVCGALLIRHVDEAGDAAEQRVLVRVEHAVGVGDLPHHLQDVGAVLVADALDDLAGEGKELGRLAHRSLGRFHQRMELLRREVEALGQQVLDGGALGRVELVVHARRLDQQGGNGELQLVRLIGQGRRLPAGEEVEHAVDHAGSVREVCNEMMSGEFGCSWQTLSSAIAD